MANQYLAALVYIRQPLIDALNQDKNGYEFAGDLVQFAGRGMYQRVLELGKENLVKILATDKPLWAFLSSIPQRTNQFLDEFLTYDEWLSKQPAEGDIQDGEVEELPKR